MIKEDAGAAEHVVSLAVFLRDPEAVLLGDGVGAVGVEGRLFVLRDLLDLAVELAGRGLVDAAAVLQAAQPHGLEHAQHAGGVDVGRKFRHIEADLYVTLGREIIDLIGTHAADDVHKTHAVAHISKVQMEIGVTLQMGDALAVVDAAAADNAVHVVAFFKKQLGKIAAVLPGNAGDQCFFHWIGLLILS